MRTLGFYNTRDFVWKNDALRNLPNELSEEDRKTFFVDYKTVSFINFHSARYFVNLIIFMLLQIDMKLCLENNVRGTRKYINKLTDEDSLEFRKGLMTL